MGTHVREPERHVREFVMVDQSRLRERIEATIEAMIAMLDELEGDPDFEPGNDDEPVLGWHEAARGRGMSLTPDDEAESAWSEGEDQDRFTHNAATEDDEPSLAAPEPSGIAYSWPRGLKTPGWGWYAPLGNASQEHWAQGDTHHGADLEEEHDGIEPDADEEPALGWTDAEVATGAFAATVIRY